MMKQSCYMIVSQNNRGPLPFVHSLLCIHPTGQKTVIDQKFLWQVCGRKSVEAHAMPASATTACNIVLKRSCVTLQTHKCSMSQPKPPARASADENSSFNTQQPASTGEYIPNAIYRGNSGRVPNGASGSLSAPPNHLTPGRAMAFAPIDATSERPPVLDLSEQSSLSTGREHGRSGARSAGTALSNFPAFSGGNSQMESSETESDSFTTGPTRASSPDVQIQPSIASILSKVTSTLVNSPDVEIQPATTISTHNSSVANQPSVPTSCDASVAAPSTQSPPGVDISLAMNPNSLRSALNHTASSVSPPQPPVQESVEDDDRSGPQVDLEPPQFSSGTNTNTHASSVVPVPRMNLPVSAASPAPAWEGALDSARLEKASTMNSVATVSESIISKPDPSPIQAANTHSVVRPSHSLQFHTIFRT